MMQPRRYLNVMYDPVDKQLRCSRYNQVLLFAGYEVAVDGKLHRGGCVRLSVHGIHPEDVHFSDIEDLVSRQKAK